MNNLLAELIKFFSEFTWRKFIGVAFMTMVIVILFSVYEFYTSSFRFSRLQNSAELITKLEEMESKALSQNEDLKQARRTVITQAT